MGWFGRMPVPRAGAGMCPRRGTFFSCVAKKRRQKKATPLSASLRFASGNLRCSRPAGSRSNSLRFTALKQSRALIRWPLRSSAHTEGLGSQHPFGPSLRSAPLRGRTRSALGRSGRAQRRPERLFGCSAVWLSTPCGCACVGAVAGWHGRRSAHASSSDSPWLSERRCAAAKRVPRRTPQPPRRRFAPSQSAGVADLGSPFLW
ncbi:hypothetical protein CLU86_0077 [Acidovorax sp. 62]|nr:hypothetical protein CLU86_0077 [Acidovorax sp. 62]